jgi:multiple sugar transport system substrate-binding protein
MKTLVSGRPAGGAAAGGPGPARHHPGQVQRAAWQAGLVDGRAYAIPIDTHPFVLFYNTDICGRPACSTRRGNLTRWTARRSSPTPCTEGQGGHRRYGGVVTGINGDTATPWRIFQSLYSQLGGEVLADDGRRWCSTTPRPPRCSPSCTLTVEG